MTRDLTIETDAGSIACILNDPPNAQWLYVLAHGAGAGMRHAFMNSMAQRFADRGIATLRYEYPYMTRAAAGTGSRRPDPAARLLPVTRAVCAYAAGTFSQYRLAAGGKSMGGRMTSQAQAAEPLPRVERLVFLGFPLHQPGKPGASRADHLRDVALPMLFLQGTRDTLADLELMRTVCAGLGDTATLHIIDGADHGFAVLKRSGRTNDEALDELADVTRDWLAR